MLISFARPRGYVINHAAICNFLCIGIVSTLIFWPLLNSIFCILLFLYWAVFAEKNFSVKNPQLKKAALFAALYLPVIFSCINPADWSESLFRLQQKSAFLVFPLVFGTSSLASLITIRRILWGLVISCIIGSLFCIGYGALYYFLTGSTGHLYGYSLIVLKDMHPAAFGLCCLLSIVFLLEEIKNKAGNRTLYIAHVILISFLITMIYLAGHRVSILCMNLVVVFYIFKIFRTAIQRFWAFLLLLSIGAACLNIPGMNERWKEVLEVENNGIIQAKTVSEQLPDGKTARLQIWSAAIDVARKNWLYGVGAGNIPSAMHESYANRDLKFAVSNNFNTHNQFLEELVAFGLPGLLIFILCFVVPFFNYFDSPGSRIYLVFLGILSMLCLTESILQLNKGIIWYSFFNSLFAFGSFTQRRKSY